MPVTVTTYPTVDATSYASVVEFKAWAEQRLKTLTGYSDDQLGAALNVAAEYMDIRFKFKGRREVATQAREWPRSFVQDEMGYPINGMPPEVKTACCGYAFLALTTELMPSPTRDETGRSVKSKDEAVGPLKTSVEYDTSSGYELPIFPAVDRLLYRRGLVVRGTGGGLSIGTLELG